MTEAEILEIVLDWLPDADEESTVDADDDEIPMMDVGEDLGTVLPRMRMVDDDDSVDGS